MVTVGWVWETVAILGTVSAHQLAGAIMGPSPLTRVTCLGLQASEATAPELADAPETPHLSVSPLPAFPLFTAAVLNNFTVPPGSLCLPTLYTDVLSAWKRKNKLTLAAVDLNCIFRCGRICLDKAIGQMAHYPLGSLSLVIQKKKGGGAYCYC